ncbi:undecaprenyl-diphosphate phosphatase [Patulibacter sp. NPDC049589]|uniref:undecaprenyl-diphosphate phosphatase n=1 Tax=Patulibacter sp. NPDC049589 TaxID=3154731 RepID=UPI00341B059F
MTPDLAVATDLPWLHAVVLGVVQGLTEFLPISSSAHLRIVAALAGWDDPGAAFTAVVQIGTELAVLVYFRHDILRIVGAVLRWIRHPRSHPDADARIGWLVIIGTLPIAILGLLLQHQIESTFRDLRLVAANLILFGLLLGLADRFAAQTKNLDELTTRRGITLGFAQALALLPGVSRSGGTITVGLLIGFRRDVAARYAFLLAVPAVLASGLFELKDIGSTSAAPPIAATALATLVSFVVGLAVITWLMRYIATKTFGAFVVYRVTLGIVVIALVATGALNPHAGPTF